jgi:hypothetical protein
MLHPGADVRRRDDDPRLVAAEDRQDRVAVIREDVGVRLRLFRARLELRELRRQRREQAERERRQAQDPENCEESEESELADPPTLGPAPISPKERQDRGSLAPS